MLLFTLITSAYLTSASHEAHKATITSSAMRDSKRYDGDVDSQESIINGMEHDMDFKEGVFVTRKVHDS